MLDIIASVKGTEAEVHVFCPDCFWGEDVPAERAVQIVEEHVRTTRTSRTNWPAMRCRPSLSG